MRQAELLRKLDELALLINEEVGVIEVVGPVEADGAPGSRTSLPRKNARPGGSGQSHSPSQCYYIGMAS